MIPIPCKDDMEELSLEARLQYFLGEDFREKYRVTSEPEEHGDWIIIGIEPNEND